MMKRNLGTLGESTLTSWAAARGISAQKATDDRNGWDYLLEFPSGDCKASILPRDREPASISCLVQVKARSTGNLNPSVRLVNWQRLIQNPLPAFFLVLEFGQSDLPRAAYLVPVDETRISHALRRIRELDSRSEAITRRRLSVGHNAEDRLEIPNGESLEKAILNHVGPSFEGYIERKRRWVTTTGYETVKGSFTIGISDESLQGVSVGECLVDLSLGLRSPLPITHGEYRDIRFNIPARVPRKLPAGEIEIKQGPPEHVEVTLSLGTSVVRTAMDMFLPRGLGNVVEERLLKVCLKSKLFHFVFFDPLAAQHSIKARFHIPGSDEREKLCDLFDLARVVLLFDENARLGGKIRCNIGSGSRVFKQGTFDSVEGIKPGFVEFAEIVRDAWAVAKHLDIHDRVELTVVDLMEQKERFNLFRNLLAADALSIEIGGFLDAPKWDDGVRVCVPIGTEVIMGNYRGAVVVSLFGEARRTGREVEGLTEFKFIAAERRVERLFAAGIDDEHATSLNAAVRAVADAQDSVPCLLLPQYGP